MLASTEPAARPPMPERIGRYRILCDLGVGSMAALYLGRAVGLGGFERLFAIKMIHEHLCRESGFVEMFLNEARIAARVTHPNVVPVYDVGIQNGRYYLAMDYVSGETLGFALSQTWTKGRDFPLPLVVHVVATVAEGLHAAHELSEDGRSLGVVHRDVAPQNVMLGYDGVVRVMDFGIAKALDRAPFTRPGTLKGTVAYMAPEQVRCDPLDRRTDIFALGAVLWEASLGMRLFKDKNDIGTATRVLKMRIPPPSSLRDDYPPDLERIVMRALQRKPSERYETAREMGDDLQDYLLRAGERVSSARLESFMMEVFEERHAKRSELERQARDPEPPRNLSAPTEAGSLGMDLLEIAESEALDLEDFEVGEPLRARLFDETLPPQLPEERGDGPTRIVPIPTTIPEAESAVESKPAAKEAEPAAKDAELAAKEAEPAAKDAELAAPARKDQRREATELIRDRGEPKGAPRAEVAFEASQEPTEPEGGSVALRSILKSVQDPAEDAALLEASTVRDLGESAPPAVGEEVLTQALFEIERGRSRSAWLVAGVLLVVLVGGVLWASSPDKPTTHPGAIQVAEDRAERAAAAGEAQAEEERPAAEMANDGLRAEPSAEEEAAKANEGAAAQRPPDPTAEEGAEQPTRRDPADNGEAAAQLDPAPAADNGEAATRIGAAPVAESEVARAADRAPAKEPERDGAVSFGGEEIVAPSPAKPAPRKKRAKRRGPEKKTASPPAKKEALLFEGDDL